MTAQTKAGLVFGALACFYVAAWGARQVLAGGLDPILKALGQ